MLGAVKEMPLASDLAGGVGVLPLDLTGFCSPRRIKASTARSRFPLSPFNTVALRLSSGKPISRSVCSFWSMPSPDVYTLEPNTLEALFTRGGEMS